MFRASVTAFNLCRPTEATHLLTKLCRIGLFFSHTPQNAYIPELQLVKELIAVPCAILFLVVCRCFVGVHLTSSESILHVLGQQDIIFIGRLALLSAWLQQPWLGFICISLYTKTCKPLHDYMELPYMTVLSYTIASSHTIWPCGRIWLHSMIGQSHIIWLH